MSCNCIAEVNEALKAHNTRLDIPMLLSGYSLTARKVAIATEKIDRKKRGNPVTVQGSYCPFCGQRYEEVKGE